MSAKFIDLLRNWGESLFTSKKAYISNQALPSDSVISIGAPTTDVYFEYTAPSDGYIVARIVGATDCQTVQIETRTIPGVWTSNDNIKCSVWGTYIPVRKGQVTKTLVRYDAPGLSQMLFVPTVGAT